MAVWPISRTIMRFDGNHCPQRATTTPRKTCGPLYAQVFHSRGADRLLRIVSYGISCETQAPEAERRFSPSDGTYLRVVRFLQAAIVSQRATPCGSAIIKPRLRVLYSPVAGL